MAGNDNETKMVADAVAGDRQALEGLLLTYHDRLETRVKRKLPAQFRGLLMAEDVLQETYVEAFRRIATFLPEGRDAFYRWLATIAEHRMLDLIKGLRAAKRGGGRRAQVQGANAGASSMFNLLEQLAVVDRTPSVSVAGHDAASAIHVALAGLTDDYREALHMRYVVGLPVKEIAERMKRTEGAIHMLCNRGLKRMREALGRSSMYFTKKL